MTITTTAGPEVLAYSAMETHELSEYAARIANWTGGVRLRVERMSTAALVERVSREGPVGKWDVIFGVALSGLLDSGVQPWLSPAEVTAVADLPAAARDPCGAWFCPSGFVAAFCLDDARLTARGLPAPRGWADLADPRFHGELVLPDPTHSGAGFLHLTALLQSGSPQAVWELLRSVAANRPRIERSAAAPCAAVASGAAAVGATVTIAGGPNSPFGRLRFIIPADAAGVEPEAFAVRRGSPRHCAALKALAWTLTPEATAAYTRHRKVGLMPSVGVLPPPLFAVDVERSVADRPDILRQWTNLFRSDGNSG